ncbi:MAG TPA: ATP-dependent DNA ligase [Candidatus Nanoarchaeia archaeon]|nr:ATP-dependent DNA ligase [Candidatus Nanoarchaeia archaeon]
MHYLNLTKHYEHLEQTPRRLEKTHILQGILNTIKTAEDAEATINLIRGAVFPAWDERKIGISEKLVIKALAKATGTGQEKIEKHWAKIGDLGKVTEQLLSQKQQQTLFSSSALTTTLVYRELRTIATIKGEGAVTKKIGIICKLLTAATPLEAKFIIRTLLEDLRIGIGEGTLRDAIAWSSFSKELSINYDPAAKEILIPEDKREDYTKILDIIQQAYDWTNDFAEVYWTLHEQGLKGLKKISLKPGRPFNVMLAIKAENSTEAAEAVGLPALCDYKLDGFRVQIHSDGKKIILFTRRLENVTHQFKELLPLIQEHVNATTFVLDAEIVGFDPKTKTYLPFQHISQRIKRKYDIEALAKKIPVEINAFDILYKDGKDLTNKSQEERRSILEKALSQKKGRIIATTATTATTIQGVETFYKHALKEGVEGIIIKNLKKPYQPGRRVGGWIKLKPVLETLDLVIVQAEYGTGKRAGTLSSYTIACLNNDKSNYLELGKVSTGLKEKEEEGTTYEEITKSLKPLIIKTTGRTVFVKPRIIIEVAYEEIQQSPSYSSGYALRFPRFLKIRTDRSEKQINTLEDVERIYTKQRGKHRNV